jgi:3-hydroxyisobutyrate dehydrogenase/2-hydroxy-3-oxopropionate reductase
VLGSRSEAEAGTLQIFVGATPEQYERWSPLLASLGTPHHVGPQGAGAAAKLVANSTLFATVGALAEALALAQRLGLSREAAYEVLAASPLAAQAERRREAIEHDD